MMKTNRKTLVTLFAFAMSIILMIACLCMGLSFVHASAATKQNKVLFIVDDDVSFSALTEDMSESGMDETLYALMHLSDATESSLSTYAAVALPANEAGTQKASYIDIQETRVYLYGNVTISAYKAATGLGEFSVEIPLHDPSGNQTSTAVQFFDEAYEQTEIFHAICSGEHALLGTISGEEPTLCAYFALILDNCKQFLLPQTRATIIESGVDYSTATFGGNIVNGIIHMNYTLYREFDETDPDYDYFALQTRTWATCKQGYIAKLNTSYEMDNVLNSFIETAPQSTNRTSSINFSIGFGLSGLTTSIGISTGLSAEAKIERDEHIVPDDEYMFGNYVGWTMTPAWSLFKDDGLKDNKLICSATWRDASVESSLRYAEINISFSGQINYGSNEQYPANSENKTVYILFRYTN